MEVEEKEIFSLKKFKSKTKLIFQSIWIIIRTPRSSWTHSIYFWKCIKIDETAETYLEKHLDVQCWNSDDHKMYLLGVLLPCFWCLAWPFFLLIFLKSKYMLVYHQARERVHQKDLNIPGNREGTQLDLNKEDNLLEKEKNYKFLTTDYVPDAYYWEIYFYFSNFFISTLAYTTSYLDSISQSALLITTLMVMLLFSRVKSRFKFELANNIQVLYLLK